MVCLQHRSAMQRSKRRSRKRIPQTIALDRDTQQALHPASHNTKSTQQDTSSSDNPLVYCKHAKRQHKPHSVQEEKIAVMAGKGVVYARRMTDSTSAHAAGDWQTLRDRLSQDGYLFIRNIVPDVLQARIFLLEELYRSRPDCFAAGIPAKKARAAKGASKLGLLSRQDLASAPMVSSVLEAPALFALMRGLLQESKVITTGFKWLRAVAQSEFTGLHTDRVFLGGGTPRLLTAWVPLGAVGPDLGSILVAAGSHRLDCFSDLRSTYGMSKVGSDGTASGWLSDNGASLPAATGCAEVDWRVADCSPGDVVVLGLDVLHMSASNESNPPRIRLSCDTRWQPSSEVRDSRLKVWHSDISS